MWECGNVDRNVQPQITNSFVSEGLDLSSPSPFTAVRFLGLMNQPLTWSLYFMTGVAFHDRRNKGIKELKVKESKKMDIYK